MSTGDLPSMTVFAHIGLDTSIEVALNTKRGFRVTLGGDGPRGELTLLFRDPIDLARLRDEIAAALDEDSA